MYSFKPLVFMQHEPRSSERPKARSGHRIVCNHKNLYSYGGFNPWISDPMENDVVWRATKPLFKEIWKFNFATQQWKRLSGQNTLPNELASAAVILKQDILMVYGGTGVPFDTSCSNRLYVCCVDEGEMHLINTKGNHPQPQYGQALVYHKSYLYTIGGTSGYEYTCDIHRFNLITHVWEQVYICTGQSQTEPQGRYRHEVAFDGKLIYVLGGGTSSESYGFSEIPAFDVEKNKWVVLKPHGDSTDNTVPEPRRCHGAVQYTDENTGAISIVISGGYNEDYIFSDVWRLDLDRLQWTCLRKCVLPCPVYFHSAALTPEGCMYTFGGIIKKQNKTIRTNAVHSVWLRIPKLSDICWEALNYYNKDLHLKPSSELLRMGVPQKYVNRIDKYDS